MQFMFMLGRTQRLSGSRDLSSDDNKTQCDTVRSRSCNSSSVSPQPLTHNHNQNHNQPIKNHISFSIDHCDQSHHSGQSIDLIKVPPQSNTITSAVAKSDLVDITDEIGAFLSNESFLQPGSASHRLMSILPDDIKRSKWKPINRFVSLPEENSKETYL